MTLWAPVGIWSVVHGQRAPSVRIDGPRAAHHELPDRSLASVYPGPVTTLCQQSNRAVIFEEGGSLAGDELAHGGRLQHAHLGAPAQQPLQQVALVAHAEGDQQAIGARLFADGEEAALLA